MTTPRRRALVLAFALVAALTGTAGAADPTEPADPEAAREEARRKQASLASDLDVLNASEVELHAAAEALAAEVQAQQAEVATSARAAQVAEAEVRAAEAELGRTRAEIERLTDRLVERAVRSFIAPERSSLHDLAVSANFTDAARKQAFIAQVIAEEAAVVDRLDEARERLEVEQVAAEAARVRADRRSAENAARLADLEAAVEEQARVQAAIEARAAEVTAEIDALAAEEASLTALIEQRAREQREAEERARAEAEAAAAAARAREQAAAEEAARRRAEEAARQRAADEAATRQRAARAPAAPGARSAPPAGRAQTEPGTATGDGGCSWPVRGVVTSEYGSRWGRLHAGIDIAAPTGTPIHAAQAGTVLVASSQGGYGLAVVIDHGDVVTLYGHQSGIATSVGERVARGEVIGYVGNTGHSTGPHLHFETRYGGTPRDPRPCLP